MFPDDLARLDTERIKDALTRSCDLCKAPEDELCRNTIQPGEPLPGDRLVHYARLEPR